MKTTVSGGRSESHGVASGSLVRLCDIGPLADGDWILNSDYSPEGVRLLQVGDVGAGRFIGKSNRYILQARAEQLDCTMLRAGDILISRMPEPIGRACRLPKLGYPAITAVDVSIWRPDPTRANASYLVHALNSPDWYHLVQSHASGATRPRISRSNLEQLRIYLPPLVVQERIAAALTRALAAVGTARRAAEERLAAAASLPAAYLREVFDGPEACKWKSGTLGDLTETCSGATPSRSHREYFGGDMPWVKTGELKDGLVGADLQTEETVTDLALRECSLPILPIGSLLVAMYGQGQTRGRTGLLACEATTNQACFAILPSPTVLSSEFLQLWFRANYGRLRSLTENRGGNQPNLNGVLLRALEVSLPDVVEQRRLAIDLARRIESADTLIARCREELAAIDALPASLLRAAVNGNS